MLELVGYASLDDLVEAVVPPAIRLRRPLELPAAKGEREALESLRDIMAHNKVFHFLVHQRQGLPSTMPPPVIQRQHPRESRLVHRLHAVPGRDRPGPARSAAQFPDDGRRFDRPRHRQCLAARRSHRRRRGDDHAPQRPGQPGSLALFRLQHLPSADARRVAHALGAAGHRGGDRRRTRIQPRLVLLRRAAAVRTDTDDWRDRRLHEIHPARPPSRRQGRGGDRSSRADFAQAAR